MTVPNRLPHGWKALHCTAGDYCGKYACEPGWSWHPPPLQDYDIWYAASGQGTLSVNGTIYPVEPGSFFVLQPGDRIVGEHNPRHPLLVYFCHFSIWNKEGTPVLEGVLPAERLALFRDPASVEPLLQQLIDLARMRRDEDALETDLLLKLILTRWAGALDRSGSDLQSLYHRKLIMQAQDLVRLRLAEPVDFEQIAGTVGFSPRYLSKLMKIYTGLSLKETVTKLRMERALYLLTETLMSVTEVADAVGYKDIYTFSKLFKRQFGCSPSRIRAGREDAGDRRS